MGQSVLTPCAAMEHPCAQAERTPGAHGRPAKHGCTAKESIARIATSWDSRFISANNHSGDGNRRSVSRITFVKQTGHTPE
jgi:hypothetical protein